MLPPAKPILPMPGTLAPPPQGVMTPPHQIGGTYNPPGTVATPPHQIGAFAGNITPSIYQQSSAIVDTPTNDQNWRNHTPVGLLPPTGTGNPVKGGPPPGSGTAPPAPPNRWQPNGGVPLQPNETWVPNTGQVLTSSATGQYSLTTPPPPEMSPMLSAGGPATLSGQTFNPNAAPVAGPAGGGNYTNVPTPTYTPHQYKEIPASHKLTAAQKYLNGDADYQTTLRDLQLALSDYEAQNNISVARAGSEYGYTKNTDQTQATQDRQDLLDDAAARGIATSGVYGQTLGNYNTSYGSKLQELTRQYNNQLTDFKTQLRNFETQQNIQKEAAKQAAIRRRAATLGKIT